MTVLNDDPTSIGNLAIRLCYSTKEEVLMALRSQETQLPLGEIMVEQGSLTREQLEHLLHLQKVERADTLKEKTVLELRRQQVKAREVASSLRETTCAMLRFSTNGKIIRDTGS